jgi:hypothetical protein
MNAGCTKSSESSDHRNPSTQPAPDPYKDNPVQFNPPSAIEPEGS